MGSLLPMYGRAGHSSLSSVRTVGHCDSSTKGIDRIGSLLFLIIGIINRFIRVADNYHVRLDM